MRTGSSCFPGKGRLYTVAAAVNFSLTVVVQDIGCIHRATARYKSTFLFCLLGRNYTYSRNPLLDVSLSAVLKRCACVYTVRIWCDQMSLPVVMLRPEDLFDARETRFLPEIIIISRGFVGLLMNGSTVSHTCNRPALHFCN